MGWPFVARTLMFVFPYMLPFSNFRGKCTVNIDFFFFFFVQYVLVLNTNNVTLSMFFSKDGVAFLGEHPDPTIRCFLLVWEDTEDVIRGRWDGGVLVFTITMPVLKWTNKFTFFQERKCAFSLISETVYLKWWESDFSCCRTPHFYFTHGNVNVKVGF